MLRGRSGMLKRASTQTRLLELRRWSSAAAQRQPQVSIDEWKDLFRDLSGPKSPPQEQELDDRLNPALRGRRRNEPISTEEAELVANAVSPDYRHTKTSFLPEDYVGKPHDPLHNTQRCSPFAPQLSSNLSNSIYRTLEAQKAQLDNIHSPSQAWVWADSQVFGRWVNYEGYALPSTSSHTQRTEDVSGSLSTNFQPLIYPSLVVHLIVTFRDRFRAPGLALAAFRRAACLSSASYITGCTQEVYTEVLATHYYAYNDTIGFTESLEELLGLGVSLNERILSLINLIVSSYHHHLHSVQKSIYSNEKSVGKTSASVGRSAASDDSHSLQSPSDQILNKSVDRKLHYSSSERAAIARMLAIAEKAR